MSFVVIDTDVASASLREGLPIPFAPGSLAKRGVSPS
jgi:hypothetical protein